LSNNILTSTAFTTESAASNAETSGRRTTNNLVTLDPRSKVGLLIFINILVLSPGPFVITLAAAVIVTLLYLSAAKWRGALKFVLFVAICSAAFLALPKLIGGPISAVFAVTGYWLTRFGVSCGYAAYFVSTTGPAQISAALVKLKLPQVVVVPIIVVIRFIPTVSQELHAISDAMVLRGIYPGPIGALLHPIRTAEYVLVPLLAASSRIADDLSASSMLRGLGSHRNPTTIEGLSFSISDAVALLCVIALSALSVFGKGIIQ
jgi:energy-coupling factor transport system permease protein